MSEAARPRPTLNLIGAGRVGQTLARLWHAQQVFQIQDVLTTSLASAQAACAFVGAGQAAERLDAMRPAAVWMLAVQDARIAEVAQQLAHSAPGSTRPPGTPAPVVFHCSGAQSSALLQELEQQGWQVASAHCILSFASAATAVEQFGGTPCALEGAPPARQMLHAAFHAIGGQCFELAAEHKLLYHAAAVFATNFLPVLEQLAEDAWRECGVPAHLMAGLRSTVMANAAANVARLGPAAALTGPGAREDHAAIARQSAQVRRWNPAAADAYDALSVLALRMAKAKRETTATPPSAR